MSNDGRGGRRYAAYVFTEQGVAMLSSVLRGKTAVAVNIEIMRAFVELRRLAGSFDELPEAARSDGTGHRRASASTTSSFAKSSRPCGS